MKVSGTLLNVVWRYLLRHPWQSALMIVGIMLGVAVVVAVDVANASANRAFDISTEAVTGRATHEIAGPPGGLDENVYVQLRREGVRAAAPVLSEYVSSPQLGNRPIQLLGVDPFAEPPFRSYFSTQNDVSMAGLEAFFTRPGAILISTDLAARYGLAEGSSLTLLVGGKKQPAIVAGLIKPADNLSRQALQDLVLCDISTAQEMTGRVGRLDRIDLILDSEAEAGRIQGLLPAGLRVSPVEARTGAISQMTAAFRINLTALSLLALVVGMFLIYNTMTFSVVQRRPLFGTLRCLGVTRGEVFALVVGEAALVGVLGSIAGLALGVIMGQGAIRMITRTINDLYFVVSVQGVEIPVSSLIKGGLLGILATVASAAPPAWEAASVSPRAALARSSLESSARGAIRLAALAGLALLAAGAITLALPTRSLIVSFGGTFGVIVGLAMVSPLLMTFLTRGAVPLTSRVWGTLGRMAPRNVLGSLSRTSVAVAALMVAVSVTIGVSIMIHSFRLTVVDWLAQSLQGDIYVTPAAAAATQTGDPLDQSILPIVERWPGVNHVDLLRSTQVRSPAGPVRLSAIRNDNVGQERMFVWSSVPGPAVWNALLSGSVIVSEPFANRVNLPRQGARVKLWTDQGEREFPVVGVYYDYTSSDGVVTMALPVYRSLWRDNSITGIGIRLEPGVQAVDVTRQLQDYLAGQPGSQQVSIRPNSLLRNDVLVIFDRTFAITTALQLLATIVALIGVLSALLSLQLERQRELGILRAVGLTVRQLWGLVMIETGLMGTLAGLLAIPTGLILSMILIYIINRRSFGWTLQMHLGAQPFIEALLVAVIAALLAGLYPAYRMGKAITAEALRNE